MTTQRLVPGENLNAPENYENNRPEASELLVLQIPPWVSRSDEAAKPTDSNTPFRLEQTDSDMTKALDHLHAPIAGLPLALAVTRKTSCQCRLSSSMGTHVRAV